MIERGMAENARDSSVARCAAYNNLPFDDWSFARQWKCNESTVTSEIQDDKRNGWLLSNVAAVQVHISSQFQSLTQREVISEDPVTMADDGFDPCECIWSHEWAVQRLLSILRHTQNYCTDEECFNMSQLPEPHEAPPPSNFFMTWLIIAFAVLMYALGPNSLRQSRADNVKDRDNGRDSNDDPRAPPSPAH